MQTILSVATRGLALSSCWDRRNKETIMRVKDNKNRIDWKCVTLLLMCCAFAWSEAAAAEPVIKTKDYYDGITYNWIDDAGEVRQSTLTEKATTTGQMAALLREIYRNPKVPGNRWGYSDGQRGPIYYNPYMSSNGENNPSKDRYMPFWNLGSCASNDPALARVEQQFPPEEEGNTVLLVTVKNTWDVDYFNDKVNGGYLYGNANDGKAYEPEIKLENGIYREEQSDYRVMNESFESVQLITQAIRVNDRDAVEGQPNNGGVLYKIDGTFDRFFFLSKGKARSRHSSMPLHRMFEQYGPERNDQLTPTFYETISNGSIYTSSHDCSTCVMLMHFYSMHGASAQQAEAVKNMCLYIPDCRFAENNDTDDPYANYDRKRRPSVAIYSVFLKATRSDTIVETHDDTNYYRVTLDWSTTIDKLCPGNDVEEEFYIYKVVNGVIESTPMAGPIYDYTYAYLEEQEEHGREITYVITARPRTDQQSSFEPVLSNFDSVIIPGYDDLERLVLTIDGNYFSQYDMDSETNSYRNLISTKNHPDDAEAICGNHLKEGAAFKLYRFLPETPQNTTEVATITITSHTYDESKRRIVFGYHVDYTNPVAGVEYPYTDGTFLSTGRKETSPVDFGKDGLQVLDAFSVSTRLNDHPARYDYQMTLKHTGTDIVDHDNHPVDVVYSNVVSVPVFKTETELLALSMEDVEADVHHTLDNSNAVNMDILVHDNSALNNYYMMRDENGNYVSRAKNNHTGATGAYTTYSLSHPAGSLDNLLQDYTFGSDESEIMVRLEDNSVEPYTTPRYVGVIETYVVDEKDQVTFNTYGSDIKTTQAITLEAEANAAIQSSDTFVYTDGRTGKYYTTEVLATATLPSNHEVVKWRVWRDVDDNDRMEVQERYMWRMDSLNATFDGLPGDPTRDGISTTGGTATAGSGFKEVSLSLTDVCGGRALGSDDALPVTYHVRVYCTDENGKIYTMRYHFALTQFTNNITTAIENTLQTSPNVKQVYYVDSTGHVSNRPYHGFNIVVTRFSNGRNEISKLITE